MDLKADRASGTLIVRAAYLEEGQDAGEVGPELAREIESMAAWLGLRQVAVEERGDLAGRLKRAVFGPSISIRSRSVQ